MLLYLMEIDVIGEIERRGDRLREQGARHVLEQLGVGVCYCRPEIRT